MGKAKWIAGSIGAVIAAISFVALTKGGIVFLIVAALMIGLQFGIFFVVIVMYTKMINSAMRAVKVWKDLDKEMRNLLAWSQEISIALHSIIQFSERAPHSIPFEQEIPREKTVATEGWTLPTDDPDFTSRGNGRID
jgi:hypothetical protein